MQVIRITRGFVSTTYSELIAKRFASGDTGIVLVITKRIHPGIQLIEYSSLPYEEEVLLPYGFWNRLKVLKKERKNGVWYIYVEEM